MTTDRLDNAAAMFHDFPCRATATQYEAIAIRYCNWMIITPDELENILSILINYLEIKQGPFA